VVTLPPGSVEVEATLDTPGAEEGEPPAFDVGLLVLEPAVFELVPIMAEVLLALEPTVAVRVPVGL
jgi:hypothetical protein